MADKRNRILDLVKYLNSLGIVVNVGKNKARGNKGVFINTPKSYRIDVSGKLTEDEILSVLVHEFAHYIHYTYDKSLKSLEFVFSPFDDEILEELISVTVQQIPKDYAESLFCQKELIKQEINEVVNVIKKEYHNFKLSSKLIDLERKITLPYKYLLKYDRVNFFGNIYSVDNVCEQGNFSECECAYIKFLSLKRALNRVNSKICKLNKYYNNNSELFARFVEFYFLSYQNTKKIAPNAFIIFDEAVKNNKIKLLNELYKIFQTEYSV